MSRATRQRTLTISLSRMINLSELIVRCPAEARRVGEGTLKSRGLIVSCWGITGEEGDRGSIRVDFSIIGRECHRFLSVLNLNPREANLGEV